jgi:hypothetical protein
LRLSLAMRVPTFERDQAPRSKISELEDFMLRSAEMQGDLARERVERMADLVPIESEWDHIPDEEWREHRRTRTETAVTHAKRLVRPELYDQIQDHEWMIKRLTEEMERLDRCDAVVSRVYTMVTGS